MFDEAATNLRPRSRPTRIKICGVTQPDQGEAVAQLGADAIGFMCVRQSPRYITLEQIRAIVERLTVPIDRVGVFANETIDSIAATVEQANLNVVQLHGSEDQQFCQQLRSRLPAVGLIKAFRLRTIEQLAEIRAYQDAIDTVLLDAYVPHALGGTGQRLDWQSLQSVKFDRPWFLAGGITPDNVLTALSLLQPDGVDLSSGVETAPGIKDLAKVKRLFERLQEGAIASQANQAQSLVS
ncbi:MAG: phosphoribosylanthranilate isomerase [Microcoleus sp. SIO2G3]|nr:phosphoribosylanthranilate isomerase [Microcoleus sp. SIO2G3]